MMFWLQASARCISSPRASADDAVESAPTASSLPVAASSANAREKSRSPVAVAAQRPPLANTVGRPRRNSALVEHVVVHERGHVQQLDGHAGSHEPFIR